MKIDNNYKIKVYRSLTGINASLVDSSATCLVSRYYRFELNPKPVDQSLSFGEDFAQKVKLKGVKKISFCRGKNLYHGRIKAFAEGLRHGGLEF